MPVGVCSEPKVQRRYTGVLLGVLGLLLTLERGDLDLDAEGLGSRLHGEGDATTIEVDLHDLDLDLGTHSGDLGRLVNVLVSHLGDVDQALDAVTEVNERAEGHELGDGALDDGADGVLLDERAPRILGGLLETCLLYTSPFRQSLTGQTRSHVEQQDANHQQCGGSPYDVLRLGASLTVNLVNVHRKRLARSEDVPCARGA